MSAPIVSRAAGEETAMSYQTRVAVLQTPWDCRFSRPGYRLTNVRDEHQPESPWVCVRGESVRRPVTEPECATCAFWEMDDVTGVEDWPIRRAPQS
jgi:hypothetical protein